MTEQEACELAIKLAGGAAALAREISKIKGQKPISRAAVQQWKTVPDKRVLAVEAVLQGQVTRHQMCPDLYPLEESA